MTSNRPEERILIIAPAGQDAAAMGGLLQSNGLFPLISRNLAECTAEIRAGAGFLVLTEESLILPGAGELLDELRAQPPWSELPLIILTSGGESRLARLLDLVAQAASSVMLLERPMNGATLLRSVQAALRGRQRQYQIRDLIEQQKQDIAKRRRAEEALRQAKDELAGVYAALEDRVQERTAELVSTHEQLETFVYSVAHDLRAPLRSINAFSQLLVEDHAAKLDAPALQLLQRIQSSSEFMDNLILDLIAFGRTARAEMEMAPVEVKAAWDCALFQCGAQIEQTGAEIVVGGPLPRVLAHEATLAQSLANLLSNALKFVTPGVRPSVRFWADEGDGSARLWMQDNGVGIPERDQERVFRVFERLQGAKYPGTGIGLSIVRKGIERMGGKTGLESTPGQGSKFWIELPSANP